MSKQVKVEIHKSHRNEWKSKRNFEDLIEGLGMYMPFDWAVRDYGIDGHVELARPIKDSDSLTPESKHFLVQLKSTEDAKATKGSISYQVPVKKIIQWYSSNMPVMLVLNEISSNAFYWLWIGEELVASLEFRNPNWLTQETVTLKVPLANNFRDCTVEGIREHVLEWKVPSRKLIQPGIYFALKDRCSANLDLYANMVDPFGFESMSNTLKMLHTQFDQAIYRIAITGPSRVGKSTLINALLRRKDISPTGIFQTTGVPIQVVPAKEDSIRISFKDGRSVLEKLSKKAIENYVSQERNPDNKKEVSLLTVELANKQLEHGVSFSISRAWMTLMMTSSTTLGAPLPKQMQYCT